MAYAIPETVVGGFPRFLGGFGNVNLRTRASFAFIEIAICPLASFKADVVLNCQGLVY